MPGTATRRTGRREYFRVGSAAESLLPTPVQQATFPCLIFYFQSNVYINLSSIQFSIQGKTDFDLHCLMSKPKFSPNDPERMGNMLNSQSLFVESIMKKSTFILAVVVVISAIPAAAEKYKCTINGYPSYQDRPCPASAPAKVVEIDTVNGKVKEREPGLQKRKEIKSYYVPGKAEMVYDIPDH